MEQAQTDDVLKARSGGGEGPVSLEPGEGFDVFVRGELNGAAIEWPQSGSTRSMRLRPGEPAVFRVKWEQVNGVDHPGQVCIVWSVEDRAAGRAPIITAGDVAKSLWGYLQDQNEPVSAMLLSARSRVKEMGRRDVRERLRYETKRVERMESVPPIRAQSISIEGFRGFREEMKLTLAQPTGTVGSGVTFVIGANNTGKSTIWESFDAIARKQSSDVSFSEGRRNHGTPTGIRLRLEMDGDFVYTVSSRNVNTSETQAGWTPSQPRALPEIVTVPSRRQFQASFGRGGMVGRDWMTQQPEFTRFRQTDQFTGRLFELHNDEEKKGIFDRLMAEVLGHELNWTIELADGQHGQSYYLKVTTEAGINHTSEGLGDGIISLLYILNALYDSEPSTLLILDEPELSLHPQLVKRLGRVLARYGADRQIVVFTHSPQLLSWDDIEIGAEIARVYKAGADSRIAQVSRETVAEVSKVRRGWRNPHTLGVDANEILFLDDGVIIVEGQEDAALLPRAFELADVPITGTIFGWGSGGEGNVAKITLLLRDLGFTRVAVVLDNNVPSTLEAIRAKYPEYLVAAIPAPDIRDKPASDSEAVSGLLDERGRTLKQELKVETANVLSRVSQYLSAGDRRKAI